MSQWTEDKFHRSTALVYPQPGKDPKITGQSAELRALATFGIDETLHNGLFVDAYPFIASRSAHVQAMFVRLAPKLATLTPHLDPTYILQRNANDPRLSRFFTGPVCLPAPPPNR
jgi:hypothetical protein